jgi:protein-tyrosine phosphatase
VDVSHLTDRLAVGDGIWTAERMQALARMGFTHVIDLQREFDDSDLGREAGIEVLWNPADDDFQPKPPQFFRRSTQFALRALDRAESRVYVHCAAGVHRGPITAAAVLCALGYAIDDALGLVRARRPVADFPAVYVDSLRQFVREEFGEEAADVVESEIPPAER